VSGLRRILTLTLLGLSACEVRRVTVPTMRPSAAPAGVRPAAQPASGSVRQISRAEALAALCRLLADRDRDCDRRLTVDDEASTPNSRPAYPHTIELGSESLELATLHQAAQFVQELVLALEREPGPRVQIDLARVRADPVSALSYRIEHSFWDALTRRIDAEPAALARALEDSKISVLDRPSSEYCPSEAGRCPSTKPPASEKPPTTAHVYVPADDARALAVFSAAAQPERVVVHALPTRITPAWMTETTQRRAHGLLTLALDAKGRGRPFVVPGGRFNEMYGWDSFFIIWGLTQSASRTELARSMVDNHAYEIRHYGKILNANRTYYLMRSQPPFFTSSIAAVLARLTPGTETTRWLSDVVDAALREYDGVWSAPPRRLSECDGQVCLARYFGEGTGEPPEVEPGHFSWFYQQHALAHGHCRRPGEDPESRAAFLSCSERFADDYRAGKLTEPAIDDFFSNDRCVRESGHDTTYRWFGSGRERCAEFATVELNALLFKYELDLAGFLASHFGGSFQGRTTDEFCERAKARARLIHKHHWDQVRGLFFDYDAVRRRRSSYVAATTLVPLWASPPNLCQVNLLTVEQARRVRDGALAELEVAGGILATSPRSLAGVRVLKTLVRDGSGELSYRASERQWEAPNGWAPHQMLAWIGLRQFGFEHDARRLAYRWLSTIVENAANYHGTVPEKFDVVRRSHRVFQEYGNVNTEFSYIASEGFGWMNASFVVGLNLLGPSERRALSELRAADSVFAH
jgi:alpha,alpha-trehalase